MCYRMEFGLQKAEKMESPVVVGNPRKRIEAKAYRARDRMDGGWFRHDAGTSENSPIVSPARSPLRAAVGRSPQVQVNPPLICAHCSCSKQAEIQQHTVAAGVRTEHFNRGHSPSKVHLPLPESAARLQQQIFANCSSWYRHEHTVIAGDEEGQQNDGDVRCSPTPAWWHSDQTGGHHGQCSPRSRRVCTKAEEYWKRNHDGSAKDWYRHEHTFVEDKENELADVEEIGVSLGMELIPSEDQIVTPAGDGCCVCGRLNVVD